MGIDETEKQKQTSEVDQMASTTKKDIGHACSRLTLLHVLIQPLKSLEKTFTRRCATTGTPIRHAQEKKDRKAYLGWTYHERSRIRCRPNFSVTSAGDMAEEESVRGIR